jgi:EAL domain-containing protein (putative c-di-GMP-specific phosphodiesterase class I)
MLRNMGCDIVQGYYFTRPVTSEEATALLEAGFARQNNVEV